MTIVSTLQEDSFRFLPLSFVITNLIAWSMFQPSKRIHSGFYAGTRAHQKKVALMFQPSKRIHSGFYLRIISNARSQTVLFQPSKRIHSGFYAIATPTPQPRAIVRFNPPRGFIPVSTQLPRQNPVGINHSFNPPRGFIPVSTFGRILTTRLICRLVSTLQEDSFRFLRRKEYVEEKTSCNVSTLQEDSFRFLLKESWLSSKETH